MQMSKKIGGKYSQVTKCGMNVKCNGQAKFCLSPFLFSALVPFRHLTLHSSSCHLVMS